MNQDDLMELNFSDFDPQPTVDRRKFLQLSGSGFFLLFTIGDSLPDFQQQRRRFRVQYPADFNAYLRIGEDGQVTCYTGKIEMGQGVVTSLAQMLAEELDVPLDSVKMVMGDTDLCPWDMGTFGSMSTRFFGPALRTAGAEARRVLLELAGKQWHIDPELLTVANGEIFPKNNHQMKVSYGELVRGKRIERHLQQPPPLKKPQTFKVMGKATNRRDAREKVTGQAKYTADIQLPGMMYAKILRPPAHGARLLDVDTSEARKLPGVLVVEDGDFIAVLHPHPDEAEKALAKIKARFEKPRSDLTEQNIFEHLLQVAPEGSVVSREGDLREGEKLAATKFDKTYFDGYVAHAPIEPHAAVVQIEKNHATVWASTQTPFRARRAVAGELGLAEKDVRVITPFVGGGYGGKTNTRQIVEAARLARLAGKPVQVAWSRAEEFFYDTYRPAAVVKIRSGLDKEGAISHWEYHVYFAGSRGAQQFYAIPYHTTVAHGSGWREVPGSHPFATGAWRAPANNTNTFARESQIDLMAAHAGIDPVDFRLRHLHDKRMRRVLQTAADHFGWSPGTISRGHGIGVACGIDAGTYVTTMAEVEVNEKSGIVHVNRVVCAQDMGLVVNPEGAKLQIEGCITMGLGYALSEDIRFRGGEIFTRNFDTYEIPRFSWLPKIETVLIDSNDAKPGGGGEPAIITMGAVLANAIYNCSGIRLYQLPLSPERIQSALAKGE